jgi:hypothetical protein
MIDSKYKGEWITLTSWDSEEPVTHGSNLIEIYEAAKKMGVKNPITFFIPKEDIQIFGTR